MVGRVCPSVPRRAPQHRAQKHEEDNRRRSGRVHSRAFERRGAFCAILDGMGAMGVLRKVVHAVSAASRAGWALTGGARGCFALAAGAGRDMSGGPAGAPPRGVPPFRSPMDMVHMFKAMGPGFVMDGRHVRVCGTPTDFYAALLRGVDTARRRVVLASLYIGTGERSMVLMERLTRALRERAASGLEVTFLLDRTRGSRGAPSSMTLLMPLISAFPQSVRVWLYQAPDLRGLAKMLLPVPFNEVVGLTHLKIYAFDDTLFMSGANLSDDYFHQRQDRYVAFHGVRGLVDYFEALVMAVTRFSKRMGPDGSVVSDSTSIECRQDDVSAFKAAARAHVAPLVAPQPVLDAQTGKAVAPHSDALATLDTWVFPLIQMGNIGIRQDEKCVAALLCGIPRGGAVWFASGYFNATRDLMRTLLSSPARVDVLTASPQANGFLGARGVIGRVPNVYTHIAKQFWRQVKRRVRISLVSC